MEGLAVGRIVHYVMEDVRNPSTDDSYKGEIRPAIIVRVWSQESGCSQLQVFTDGANDGAAYASGTAWKTSRLYDADGAPGTWHWPTRA